MKRVLVGLVVALVSALVGAAGFAGDAIAQGSKIIAYVAYADYEEEWENTKRAIIKSGVIPDFLERLVEVKEEANDPDKLRAYLADAFVFLIPEQEEEEYAWPMRDRGRRWASVLKEFLARGGRIVGLWDSVFYLNGAGLTVAGGEAVDDAEGLLEVVVPDHPLVTSPLMVSRTFRAENATVFYPRVDGTVLVRQKDRPERPVVFVKDIEAGQIVVLGFDFYRFNDDMMKLLANAVFGVGVGVDCKGSIKLEANELLTGQKIGAKALTDTREQQYCIFVAEGAKLLAIKLESKGNLDLHIRQGKPIERSGSAIIADYSLPSPDGNEFLIIFAPQLKKGPYFIAVENKEDSAQEFTLIATPIFDIQELKGSAEGQVDPNAGLLPFLRQYLATRGGLLSLTQYKFEVPNGAKSVTVRLEAPADKNLNLHLRHDKPVEIVADRVAADLSVLGPGGQKGVVLAGALLKAGRWYIAVESLQTEKVDYKVVVEIEVGTQRIMMVLEREPRNNHSR